VRRGPPLLLALLALAVVASILPTGDPDLWWHLAAGQRTLAGVDLSRDVFSWTFAGQPWRYRDVAADVVLYEAFARGGFYGLVALRVLVALGVGLAIDRVQRQPQAAVTLAGTAALLVAIRLVERPNLFTIALFPLLVSKLERTRWDDDRRRWLGVVGLAWLWLLLHRAGVLGIGLVAMYAALRPSKASIGAALATACLSLCTPMGVRVITTSFGVVTSPALRQSISEWQRLPPLELVRHFPVGLACCAVALVTCTTRRAWRELGLVVAFTALSLESVRWVPYAATVGALMTASLAPALPRIAPACALPLGLAWLVVAHPGPFHVGEDVARTPRVAAELVAREPHVVNALALGGYLIWRGVPVFVDGRNETVYPPEFLERAIDAERDRDVFAAMRADDWATIVVASNAPGRMSHAFLAGDPAWMLVSWSDAALVWARRDAHPELAPSAFVLLDPRSLDGSVVRALTADAASAPALGKELQRVVEASPDSTRALVALAVYHEVRGDAAARDRVLDRLDALDPDHPAVRELERRLGRVR